MTTIAQENTTMGKIVGVGRVCVRQRTNVYPFMTSD